MVVMEREIKGSVGFGNMNALEINVNSSNIPLMFKIISVVGFITTKKPILNVPKINIVEKISATASHQMPL